MRFLVPLALAFILVGCGEADAEPSLTITNATVSANPSSAAVYATIENRGGADRLTNIEIDRRVPITLHETTMDGGVMRMRAVDSLDISANGRLELKSGGAHGMAIGKVAANPPSIPLTFQFARSAPISVSATITGPGGTPLEPGH